ncbi:MAG TPA: radical SAM protein [Myxococcota bacterium]|nr:radical SAM protein [Myxococcota bacterium]
MAGPKPRPLVANPAGEIVDLPGQRAAARAGNEVFPLDPAELVPLPEASELLFLPARRALAFGPGDRAAEPIPDALAVAAFLPPGWTALAVAAYRREPGAPTLPLYAYTAVCWHRGRICVPARRVDGDPKHDPETFSRAQVQRRVAALRKRLPNNRLVEHHGRRCALEWGCPNAQNLFLGRFEAPIALARSCNAACVACISEAPEGGVPAPQARLDFKPSLEEILELAVPHLERAPRAMISFGQGCEGEPLLEADRIEQSVRAIRARTARGTLHLNTNGSRPDAVARLAAAGLDSIRVSLNSARETTYARYYRPRTYGFGDVVETLHVARRHGLFCSLNLLSFPGVTDRADEADALAKLVAETGLRMIQWRCLNVDPDLYMATLGDSPPAPRLGMNALLLRLRQALPALRFGYFNPPAEDWR